MQDYYYYCTSLLLLYCLLKLLLLYYHYYYYWCCFIIIIIITLLQLNYQQLAHRWVFHIINATKRCRLTMMERTETKMMRDKRVSWSLSRRRILSFIGKFGWKEHVQRHHKSKAIFKSTDQRNHNNRIKNNRILTNDEIHFFRSGMSEKYPSMVIPLKQRVKTCMQKNGVMYWGLPLIQTNNDTVIWSTSGKIKAIQKLSNLTARVP